MPFNGDDSDYSKIAKNMYESDIYDSDSWDQYILKYGGFYIARYEAGVSIDMQHTLNNIGLNTNDARGIPVSIADVRPWNYISYENAKANAESMYNTDTVNSSLPTIRQVFIIMDWLNNSGYDAYNDSSNWGNFSNVLFNFSGYYSEDYGKTFKYTNNGFKTSYNIITSSGASDRNMANNIYDLAGNLREYTSSRYADTEYYFSYSGHYDTPGNQHPASSTFAFSKEPYHNIGYRVVLVLKD